MAYASATYFLNYEGGSDTARTALTTVTVANNGSGLVRCTKAAHGLVTGAVGTASLNYAGDWKVTVIDVNTFDLVGSVFSTSTSLTFTPFGGASKADAWKTFIGGATAARIAPGDTIRVMASPDPTLVGNATWTQYSKAVTLATAVTATISNCDTNWTPSTNVTATAAAPSKEGNMAVQIVVASAFTTGLVAFFATGTLNLAAYQQVSFWINPSIAVAASTLSLRLCSDVAGVTTVHNIAIPALPAISAWVPLTIDLATNLSAAIASVALYADLDPGTITVALDDIIACKASASADSLTLTSLIAKVRNMPWIAATTYAVGDMRIPTASNRNGYCYRVTAQTGASSASEPSWPLGLLTTVTDGGVTWRCDDIEEPWAPIKSINGTAVVLDGIPSNATQNVGRGYAGTTEVMAMYKREAIKTTMTTSTNPIHQIADSGSSGLPLLFSGGWNRVDMTTQTGQTWYDGQCGGGLLFQCASLTFIELRGFGGVRANYGVFDQGQPCWVTNTQMIGMTGAGWSCSGANPYVTARGLVTAYCNYGVSFSNPGILDLARFRIESCTSGGLLTAASYHDIVTLGEGNIQNNTGYGIEQGTRATLNARNVRFGNNATAAVGATASAATVYLFNCLTPEATPFAGFTFTGLYDQVIYSTKHNGVADAHLITLYGGTIISATDQRHTASGIAWKFRPTLAMRGIEYPLRLSVAKLACVANIAVNVSIWTRRDSTNILGTLKLVGGQIAGAPIDVTVACAPAVNTWVQSSSVIFTPTEAGVVELVFECYDGVGTANSFWVDDLVVG